MRVKTHIFLCIIAQTGVNKIKDRLKQTGWLEKEKGNSFSLMLDILSGSSLGIFEIEKVERRVVTKVTEKQEELLKLFNIPQRVFNCFDYAKEICSLT